MIRVENRDKKKKTPHLALVHQMQGGSANKRHASILMKSVDELTDEQIEKLHSALEEIEKSTFNSLRDKLNTALTEKYRTNNYDYVYVWVRDFDENTVVYEYRNIMYAVNYSLSESGEISFSGEEIEVKSYLRYEDSTGSVVMSESDFDGGLKSLIEKSVINNDDAVSKSLKEIIKNEYEVEKTMKDELEKATSALADKDAEIQALQTRIAELEASEKERITKSRTELLKAAVGDDAKAEELVKALDALDDAQFTSVVSQMSETRIQAEKEKAEVEKASGLFDQMSEGNASPVEKSTNSQKDALAGILAKLN